MFKWWRGRQRKIDKELLWPSIKMATSNIAKARHAFLLHCLGDRAWNRDYSFDDLVSEISKLD